MMLETIGAVDAGRAVEKAVHDALASGKIKSLAAGKMGMGTREMGDFVASFVK
jgi:3-isopropylmalate dehydrogenase